MAGPQPFSHVDMIVRGINAGDRIPCMTDTFDDGKPIRLFESGSMMQYLCVRTTRSNMLASKEPR